MAAAGTVLIALMLLFVPPATAIPAHGVVQLASNTWRIGLFQDRSFAGADRIFCTADTVPASPQTVCPKEFPLWAFVPLGFVTGALNMIVGVIAPVPGVLIIRKDLNKENVVGTLGFFAFIGNLLKIAAFTLVGFSFAEYALLLVPMTAAVRIGTSVGKKVLSGFDEKSFLLVFNIMLISLALKLIVFDGLRALLGY